MLQLNKENLIRVLKDFYTLTQLRIVLFDNEFQELLSYPPQRQGFCAAVRKDAAEDSKCRASDRQGCMECAKMNAPVIYRCHAGLTEAVVLIRDKHGAIGYIMFGQVIPEDCRGCTIQQLERRYPALTAEIGHIAVKPEGELSAAATVLQALTTYVLNSGWVVPGKSEFIRHLDHYIENHLAQTITVDSLCKEFRLNRSRMYALAEEYLGCGLAEYVRGKRVMYAQQLLAQTNLPVSEVSGRVGFSDYNHFSRIFKQTCGVSAREYRKRNEQQKA